MKMSAKFLPIQRGHFFWCAKRNTQPARGCFHCKALAYLFACVLGIVLAGVEWYGSGLTQSLALLSDALHVSFDALGYVIGLMSLWHGYLVSHDHERFHRGQERFEVAMGMFIAVAATVVLKEAYGRLMGGGLWVILRKSPRESASWRTERRRLPAEALAQAGSRTADNLPECIRSGWFQVFLWRHSIQEFAKRIH